KGTGLGLYIVKKLVDLHHGHLALRDNKPKGTLFEVSLPV
ncbi:MAG: ATP-binding protein, partial [Bacteroidota bacterium]